MSVGKYVFRLPDIGEGVVEGEVVIWHVSVGDKVSEDDPIVDVMTDKATVTIPSPTDGVVTSLSGDVGDMIAVGTTLVEFDSDSSVEISQDAPAEEQEEAPVEKKSAPEPISSPKRPRKKLLLPRASLLPL